MRISYFFYFHGMNFGQMHCWWFCLVMNHSMSSAWKRGSNIPSSHSRKTCSPPLPIPEWDTANSTNMVELVKSEAFLSWTWHVFWHQLSQQSIEWIDHGTVAWTPFFSIVCIFGLAMIAFSNKLCFDFIKPLNMVSTDEIMINKFLFFSVLK